MEHTQTNLEHPTPNATVVELSQESTTIKRLLLQVEESAISFRAGQWVDFFIPGISVFTGYSMSSAPHRLTEDGVLELAVKYSDYPPTLWVHTQCKVGDKIAIRVGGTLFYEKSPSAPSCDLLLLAAGIGINPIYSIYQHFIHSLPQGQGDGTAPNKLFLLYSAKSPEELVFKDQILEMANSWTNVKIMLFSTQKGINILDDQSKMSNGRISATDINACTATLDKTNLQTYICGPPAFIDDMEQNCLQDGLESHQIHYEKWW